MSAHKAHATTGSVSKSLRRRAVAAVLLACLAAPTSSYATYSEDYVIKVSAVVQESPPQITLTWPSRTGTHQIYIYRKTDADDFWVSPGHAVSPSATQYNDTDVSIGTAYEYMVYQSDESYTLYSRGYVYSGIKIPLVETRGKVILIVDDTCASPLASELARLEQDLIGDGWEVLRHDVARTETVPNVKALIQADYNADPLNVKAVFLLGHVPVPYSGDINPDGHTEHLGAWPADVFYGEMNGTWTDTSVNDTGASRSANDNIPGDGKYDQSSIPTEMELMVGRVDLADMPAFAPLTEPDLLRQYLNKDHDFRHKTTTAQARALVDDNFNLPEGPAQSGWRFSALVGASNVAAGDWSSLVTNDYLLAYGCGAGTYTSASGIASTSNYAANTYRAMFQMLFGSYFGDWDNTNNLLRAPLCNPTYGLTSCWVARPNWFIHHMGLGKTIGHGARLSTTNSLYDTSYCASQVHIALMGDPTLRLQYVAPPSALTAMAAGGNVDLAWTASPDTGILGYYIYRSADPGGPFTWLNVDLEPEASYSDTAPLAGDATYMVRAVRLETSASGTYYNASQGVFVDYSPALTPPPAPVITTDGGNGPGADYVTNDPLLTLSGTCDSSLVSIEVNSATDGVMYMPGGTTWSYDGTLTEGANVFDVTGTDAQPLTSVADTITITLDTVPPTATLACSAPDPVSVPITVVATLSESSTTFNASCIAAANANVSGFTGSGTTYSFTLTPVAPGSFSCRVPTGTFADAAGNVNVTPSNSIVRVYELPLADALDNASLTWATGGNVPWFGQTGVSHDHVDAGRSGAITHGQSSELTTQVAGPGTLSFWWKVSSEANHDFLRFSVDGVLQDRISGEVWFTQKAYSLGPGTHVLKWKYSKDASGTSGQDAAWLDQVSFVPNVSLGEALDDLTLAWSTQGNATWFGQSATTHDGQDAARSGALTHGQSSEFSTQVTGPGTLSFWWKVWSEAEHDFLRFSIDGVLKNRISGNVYFNQKQYALGPGTHLLKWKYSKDATGTAGQDAAWVDQVVWTPSGK